MFLNIFSADQVENLLQMFKGSKSVTLSAELSAGDGSDAWQHTQLFRQKRDSQQCTMSVEVMFD